MTDPNNSDIELEVALEEARRLNAAVRSRCEALLSREAQLREELEKVREALAALPTPRDEPAAGLCPTHLAKFAHDKLRNLEFVQGAPVSELIKMTLAQANEPMSAFEIKSRLERHRTDISYGLIHTSLSRMHSRGDIVAAGERGERRYALRHFEKEIPPGIKRAIIVDSRGGRHYVLSEGSSEVTTSDRNDSRRRPQ